MVRVRIQEVYLFSVLDWTPSDNVRSELPSEVDFNAYCVGVSAWSKQLVTIANQDVSLKSSNANNPSLTQCLSTSELQGINGHGFYSHLESMRMIDPTKDNEFQFPYKYTFHCH